MKKRSVQPKYLEWNLKIFQKNHNIFKYCTTLTSPFACNKRVKDSVKEYKMQANIKLY